ncbi:TonB-dependent receptor [Sphingomonas histidinilytica]|jgi:outer membrane receptor protein involved in Fe transport|uniref:Outer membrane receptor proteins, mostly Fe transport n=1 Tax=Rhizorhabdus histidinilytica TaxID=439228 RepID=A0A1T5FF08_9SPHN|nr:TonB-dependent receptor [Rhizorhabdus histidinilytica]MBO9375698.1 TonB-dependent receptor [Rhizorhabdus histidinilytica]QEH81213.1 TonB-dependent receptor [Sphingomonas sp. C8-2]SKB94760.1 Outer membrane receptor proteins, mostly Fe transport [Rhizorhabdus histidinilytica]
MKTLKLVISVSTAAVALAASMPALAQDAQVAEDGASAGEIIVTAQKRAERLIDVPVAISAISADALTTQNINRLSEYFDRVPGLQYSNQRVSGLALRGVTTGGATSPTVALLVDDVQFGGTTGTGQPPLPDFDASAVSRVEVLRGPQGTLYGASSLGGLIKYVLKEPDTKEFSGRIELGGTAVSHGDTGYAVRGSVNIPINDWLAVLGSGFKREDAAYLNNANPQALKAKDVNSRDVWGFRGAALIKPADNFRIVLSALRQKTDAMNSDLAITAGGVPVCAACTLPSSPNAATAVTTFEPVYGDLTINSLDSINKAKFQLYSARAELELGGVNITSISAWSRADNVITSDVSRVFGGLLKAVYGLPTAPTVQIANADRTHKFSQELRLGGDIGTSFTWLAGGFYTVEHAATDQTLIASGSLTATPYIGTGPGTYREYAGFADLTWHATDKLDIQVGGRYAHNKQHNESTLNTSPETAPVFGSGTTIADSSDSAFTWLISPSYHFSRDIIAYARVATGYRPGGPNIAAPPSVAKSFSSDKVINYELGFKGKVVPGLLTLDASLFQIDWKDIQLQGTDSISSLTFLTNGGKARSRGLEFAASLTPWQGMSIDASLTFTDATLTEDLPTIANATGLKGLNGDRLPFSAKVAANVTAQQVFPLTDRLEGNVGFTLVYVGDRAGTFVTDAANATRPRMLLPEYTTVDIRGGLTFDEVWSANLYVRNLFDKRGVAAADNRNGVNVPTALFIQPRTFGVTLARSF